MDTEESRKGVRRRTVACIAFALFIAASTVLAFAAYQVSRMRNIDLFEELQVILQDAEQERDRLTAAVEHARKALPPDTTLPYGWEYQTVLKFIQGRQFDPLMCLVTSLVFDTAGTSEASRALIREALDKAKTVPTDNPFCFPFSARDLSNPELLQRLSSFLLESKPLCELEEALELGLLEDVSNAYHNPLASGLGNVAVLFAGRAVCELEKGNTSRALETLLAGYGFANLLANWTHVFGPCARYYADRVLDRALWRLVDAGPVSRDDRKRILTALETRKAVERLVRTLRTHAAYLEFDEVSNRLGYPRPVDPAFSFTGRGALKAADHLIDLLGTPPYQARVHLDDVGGYRIKGYWGIGFVANAVEAYKMHAHKSLMADMALLAFTLKDWQQEHGTYPASLEELQPFPLAEIPREPLTGNPIAYETDGTFFRLTGENDGTMWPEPYWISSR